MVRHLLLGLITTYCVTTVPPLGGVAEKAKTEDLRRRKLQDLERYVENYPVYPRFCNMHVDLIA